MKCQKIELGMTLMLGTLSHIFVNTIVLYSKLLDVDNLIFRFKDHYQNDHTLAWNCSGSTSCYL